MARVIGVSDALPASTAQLVFTLGSAIAGGIAGIIISRALVGKTEVRSDPVAVATVVSVAFTIGAAAYLARRFAAE